MCLVAEIVNRNIRKASCCDLRVQKHSAHARVIFRCLHSQREGNLQPKQPIVQVYGSFLNHTVIFILTQAVGGIIIHLGAGWDVIIGLRGLRVHALGTVVAFTHEGLVG